MNSVVQRKAVSWLVIAAMLIGLAMPGGQSEAAGEEESGMQVLQSEHEIVVSTGQYDIRIEQDGFKYSFEDGSGNVIAPAHAESGLKFGSSSTGKLYDAGTTELTGYDEESVSFLVTNSEGHKAVVRIIPSARYAKFQVEPEPFQDSLQALRGEGGTGREALIWGGNTAWDNYKLELDMKQNKLNSSSASGVLVRYQDYNNFYHVRFHLQSNKLQLYKKRNGGALSLLQEVSLPEPYNSAKLYRLAVEADGNRLRGYLDNTLMLDYTDGQSPILSGAIGMRVYSDIAQYSNLSLTSGETVLLDNADLESQEDWHAHNGDWRMAGQQAGTAIIDARTASLSPGYGMGDFAHNLQSTNVFGVSNSDMTNKGGDQRFVSNFTIFPAHGFAQVLFETGKKRVAIDASENKLGVDNVGSIDALYYFMGTMEQIYADYQQVRVEEGYPVYKPKYDFFEVGYEAFGSLGWNTYQTSVMNDLSTYLDKGYKLKWGVVGSGFWKGDRNSPSQGATTSFGIWDDEEGPPRQDGLPNPRYPDVAGLKQFFRDNDMNLLLGLRTNFKALKENGGNYTPEHDGPYTVEGINNGYFLSDENGVPSKFSVNFPSGSVHLLDTYNEEALDWYADGVELWGVDGFKEDTMMGTKPYQDGLWNHSDGRLMEQGYQVMVRNAAYSVPGDILRLEDTQHGSNQDRPIINALNYAASGASNVYSDIVAGKYLTLPLTEDQKKYFVRNAMWATTTPAMSLGLGPWHMENAEYEAAVKKAVDFHSMYAPYIYSAAVDSYHTGFPYTMTPLPIAYPNDAQTYQLANRTTRQYEWMLGPSMLAVPAYGQDYATVTARDVYLPEGKWMDFETGQIYNGPVTLPQYSLPIDKIPVFIGGKGVVAKRDLDSGKLLAEVYPIAAEGSSYTYTYPDGETVSTIVNGNAGWNNETIRITDTVSGQEVAFEYSERTGSYTFELTEGHHYELSGGEFDEAITELLLPQDQPTELISDETLQLRVEAKLDSGELADPTGLALTYETDRPDIITINANGEVAPLQTGTAMVRVSAATEGGSLSSQWLAIHVVEPELAVTEPANLAVLTADPIVVSGTSTGLAELEIRYNGTVQSVEKSSDGSWTATIGRLENGEYGIQVAGRDKNGLIRKEKHVRIQLDVLDTLLRSDFDGDSDSWSIVNGNWGLAEVDNRQVYGATGRGLAYAGETSWSDYRVEADIMMAPVSTGGSSGIVFRYQDTGNFYHVRLDDHRTGGQSTKTIQLYKWVGGAASKIAEAPFEFQYGQWYKLSAEVDGSAIQASVDGVAYIEANDTSLSSGAVGIRTYDRNTSVDELTVSRLTPDVSDDFASWRNGSAEVRDVAGTELTLSWSGDVQGVQTAQYRVYVNNEPIQTLAQANEMVVSGLIPGKLYSLKVEAGEENRWSTDGPVIVYRMPADEQPEQPEEPEEPTTPPPPGGNDGDGTIEEPGHNKAVRVVTGAELAPSASGEAVIRLEADERSAVLPISAAELGYTIVIQTASGHAGITLAPSLLASLLSGVAQGEADFFRIDVTDAAMTTKQSRSLGRELRLSGSGTQRIDVGLVLKNGDALRPDRADKPSQAIRMALAFDASRADSELLGLYLYDEGTGAWIYAGGTADPVQGVVIATVDQPGIYAVLQRNKTFGDVAETHWAYRTLQVLSAKHIVNGVSETAFAPSGLTTRAEFTALLVRALGLSAGANEAAVFEDVPSGAWYEAAVAAAFEAGLIQGVAEQRFAPDARITREQMAVMIVRAFEYAGGGVESSEEDLDRYADRDKLSGWAADAVHKAVASGLMQGTAGDTFNPRVNATRAQTAQAVYNLLKLLSEN